MLYTRDKALFGPKRNAVLTHATAWMSLEDVTPSDISHRRKDRSWDGTENGGFQGLGRVGKEDLVPNGRRFQFCKTNVLEMDGSDTRTTMTMHRVPPKNG